MLEICEGGRDLLLGRSDGCRALTSVIVDIYALTRSAISALSLDGFENGCAAFIPIAETDPDVYLRRNGRIAIGTGDDPARPIERMVELLDRISEDMWPTGEPGSRHPRVWSDVVVVGVRNHDAVVQEPR